MQMGILITNGNENGGIHPSDKWAVITAEQICGVNPDPAAPNALAAKRLQLQIAEILMPHHQGVSNSEKGHLKALGDDHLDTPHDPIPAAERALADVIAAYQSTPFAAKTNDPAWRAVVGGLLATHFATSADIERQWHCHRNPSEKAKAFLAAKSPPPEMISEPETAPEQVTEG